jgi:hypothetical protein
VRRLGVVDIAAGVVGLAIAGAVVGPMVVSASGGAAVTSAAVPVVASALVALVLVTAISSGARGGPLALESATVFLVLLAPVDRGLALRAPALRQVAVGALVGAVVGGVAGLSVAPRLAELRLGAWVGAGGVVGALFVGLSVLVAGLPLRPLVTRALQGLVVAWWALDAWLGARTSPAWVLGASWPLGGFGLPAAAVVAIVAVVATVGVARVGHLSLEKAWRRSGYADQFRLAVGLNDLRTALLVVRRRANEAARLRPWAAVAVGRHPVSQRAARSVLRWPVARVLRLMGLAIVTGAAATMVVSTPAAFAVVVVLVYVGALDAADPLAEELDHPHLLAMFPLARGELVLRHLGVPVVVLGGLGLVAATTAMVLGAPVGLAFGLVPPLALAGVAGAALTASRIARPLTTVRDIWIPPEVLVPRILLRVGAPLLPIGATLVPPVLAFAGGSSGSWATCLGGVLLSVAMIAWSALVRR